MNVFYQRSQSAAFSAVRILALIAVLFSFLAMPLRAEHEAAGPAATTHVEVAAHAENEHHGLPAAAPVIFHIGPLPVNNSMLITWIVAALIIGFAQYATRRIRSTTGAALEVPSGAQNFWEFLVEGLRDFLEGIIGRDLAKRTFWFFATVFIFILFTNWFSLLPGVGTIGMGHLDPKHGFIVTEPFFRGGNADLNMTFAMSMIFFVCWTFWALSTNGFGGFIMHIFGNPARKEMMGLLKVAMGGIFVLVGLIEVVSIIFRPISLSFRLYGNIYAGETLLETMQGMVPALGWLMPLPFYFIEVLVGFVQALVYMLLTAVFTLLICSHGDDHEHAEHGDHKDGAH